LGQRHRLQAAVEGRDATAGGAVPHREAGRPLELELGADATGPGDLPPHDRLSPRPGDGVPRHAQRPQAQERVAAAPRREMACRDPGAAPGGDRRGPEKRAEGDPERPHRAHRGTGRAWTGGRTTTGWLGQYTGPPPHAYQSGSPPSAAWASASCARASASSAL